MFSFIECSPAPEIRAANSMNAVSSSGENSITGNEDGSSVTMSLPSQPRINGTIPTYNHGIELIEKKIKKKLDRSFFLFSYQALSPK